VLHVLTNSSADAASGAESSANITKVRLREVFSVYDRLTGRDALRGHVIILSARYGVM